MSRREDAARLRDILDAAVSIEKHLQALEQGRASEQMAMDAIKYNLVAIGEATSQLSEGLKDAHSDIDWVAIKGLRNLLTHEYFRIDHDLIRDIANEHVPDLAVRIHEIVRD